MGFAFLARMCLAPLLIELAPMPIATAPSGTLPRHLYDCTLTRITALGQRLEDANTGSPIAGSGSAVSFANGGYQVSYEEIPPIQNARPGDQVLMCLVRIPNNCPPGDERGRIYTTTDLRTLQSWTLADSEHSCGGA